jgi:hypothetical protein
MKKFALIVVIVVVSYFVYSKYLDSAVKPIETYKKFTTFLNDARYDSALKLTDESSGVHDAIKNRKGWSRAYQIAKITETVNKITSKSMSEDGTTASFDINQRAWVVPGTTPPAYPDFLFRHRVVLEKTGEGATGWMVSEFEEEIESLGKR